MNRIPFSLSLFVCAFFIPKVFATGDWARPPQGLDHYLHRLPGKSLAQLVKEKEKDGAEMQEGPVDEDGIKLRLRWLLESMGKSSRSDSIKKCDDLLMVLRQSSFLPPAWANLVLDLRDCLADAKTLDAEALLYCKWRHQLGGVSRRFSDSQRADLLRRLATTRGRTAAHYRYLAGVDAYFDDDEESEHGQVDFAAVVEAFPDHPRAETALFMIGRSALKNSKGGWGDPPAVEDLDIAESVFKNYLKRFPKGRFYGDVQGWLGAVAVKREEYAEALGWYLRQMEVKGHPENVRSATRMIERVIALILAKPDEGPLVEIAAHPEVAMGTVYWILYAPEADLYNGFYDHPEVVKRWRSHWLPRLARAIQENEAAWRDHEAMPWFVAIQAHAASDAGDQKRALGLVEQQAALLEISDDLAFVRAVILQRMGEAADAVNAYRNFLTDFPSSPLSQGAIFRLATAYQDAGKSDDALAVLLQLLGPDKASENSIISNPGFYEVDFYPSSYASLPPAASALSPDMSVAELGQVRQYMDTLLQFAPLEELSRLERLKAAINPAHWQKIRIIILGRSLSEGRADLAASFSGRKNVELTRQISDLIKASEDEPSAGIFLNLGNAWASARGRLTSPALLIDRAEIYVEDSSDTPEKLRMANASAIGFSDGVTERILKMDELWNAVQAWEKAVALAMPGSPEQAKALGSILDALPKIAMATPFARRFAVENGWNEWAAKRYRQLITDCPESVEDIAAARPFFRMGNGGNDGRQNEEAQADPAKASPFEQVRPAWVESLYGFSQKYMRHREFLYGSLLESGKLERTSRQTNPAYQGLVDRLYAMDGAAPLAQLVLDMESLRKESRRLYRNWNDACIHYAIEDLADLVILARGLDPGVRARYFVIRRHAINVMVWNYGIQLQDIPGAGDQNITDVVLKEVDEALADPRMKGIADRLQCLRLFLVANRGINLPVKNIADIDYPGEKTISTRDYAAVEKGAKEFLATYPDSSKREAVWLLYLRAVYRARRPLLYSRVAPFPENPFIAAQYIRETQVNQLPWNPLPVEDAIKAYLDEYQNPKYTGEVLDLQAAVAVRKGDWTKAISDTLLILQDPSYADLHSDSRLRLSNIFAQLAESTDRVKVLKAIKSTPGVHDYFLRYLDASDKNTWGMEPLYFFTDWLRGEIDA